MEWLGQALERLPVLVWNDCYPVAVRRCITLAVCITAIAFSADPAAFTGTWVMKMAGRNFLVLVLKMEDGQWAGSTTRPAHFQMDQDGDLTQVSPGHTTSPVRDATVNGGELRFSAGDDHFIMRLEDADHATLKNTEVSWWPAWKLQRAAAGTTPQVADDWPGQQSADPEIAAIQKHLAQMIEEDQAIRKEPRISNRKMLELAQADRTELLRIFDKYGWPKISQFGKEAAHNYWLLVQHQDAEVQRKLLPAMEEAAKNHEASMRDYAYLYDRVQDGEGKPQHWGSQAKCIDGKAVLTPVDDPSGLGQRRRELGLQPIDEYLKVLQPMCRAMMNDAQVKK